MPIFGGSSSLSQMKPCGVQDHSLAELCMAKSDHGNISGKCCGQVFGYSVLYLTEP